MSSSRHTPLQRDLHTHFTVPEHVAYRSFSERTILANLESGTYHGLNPTGGRMLEALEEAGSFRKAASRLAKELDQPFDRVLDDLAELIVTLERHGLVEVGDPGSHRVKPRHSIDAIALTPDERLRHESLPTPAPMSHIKKTRVVIEILRIYVPMRIRFGRNNLKILKEIPHIAHDRAPHLLPSQTAAMAIRLGEEVARALVLFPTDSRCLIRSLVLMRLLSRYGIEACLVIGVHHGSEPFTAHAWVEHRGIPLLDHGDGRFARLLQIEAS